MTVNRRRLLRVLGATPLVAGAALALPEIADASTRTPPRDLLPGGAFDRLIAQLAAQDRFSGTVLLSHQRSTVLARCYGMADRQRGVPIGPDTIFSLASAGKPFTGVAVTQLAQQGRIEFGATLGTYLDGFPAAIANTVTVHQLLTHTSGMGDYLGTEAGRRRHPLSPAAPRNSTPPWTSSARHRCCSPPALPTATATPATSRSARSSRGSADCPITTTCGGTCSARRQ